MKFHERVSESSESVFIHVLTWRHVTFERAQNKTQITWQHRACVRWFKLAPWMCAWAWIRRETFKVFPNFCPHAPPSRSIRAERVALLASPLMKISDKIPLQHHDVFEAIITLSFSIMCCFIWTHYDTSCQSI